MAEEDLIIGAANDNSCYCIGIHEVRIRRQSTEPYIDSYIHIVREATKEEYIKYHEEHNLNYDLSPTDKYFAFYMD